MMAIYYIQSWRLCYIARHHLPFQSIPTAIYMKTQFISGRIDLQLLITQLGCPPPADIILPGISCTFACHYKSRHVCALRTAYSLAQWLHFYILSLYAVSYSACISFMFSIRRGCFVVNSSSTSKRQSTSPST